MKRFLSIAMAALCLNGVFATTYYVSTTGSDFDPGTILLPFATVQQGHNVAGPGDTIMVRGGLYERAPVTFTNSGTAANPIVYINYPGEVPIISGWQNYSNQTYNLGDHFNATGFGSSDVNGFVSHITVQGFHFTGWKWGACTFNWDGTWSHSNPANHVVATNCNVRFCSVDRCGQNGINLFYTDSSTLEYNVVSRTGYLDPSWSSGINCLGIGKGVIVRNNVSFQNIDVSSNNTDGNGIIIDIGYANSEATLYNNICFNNGGGGISVTKAGEVKLFNNTMWGNGYDAPNQADINFTGSESFVGFEVRNNIIFETGNGGDGYKSSGGSIFDTPANVSNNNFSKPGASVIITDPLLEDLGPGFDPTPSDLSTMTDAGTSIGVVTHDNGLNFSVIKSQTSNQFHANWDHEIDLAFIQAQGGLINCYSPRLRDGNTDIGAIEKAVAVNVSFTSLVDGTILDPCATHDIDVNASTQSGTITSVKFFDQGALLGEDFSSPYSYTWASVPEGTRTVMVRAYNNSGDSASKQINLTFATNRISNPEIDNGLTVWELQENMGGDGTMTAVTGQSMSGANAMQVCLPTPSTARWHVQVRQTVGIENGGNYTISFLAKADAPRSIQVALQEEGGGFTTYMQTTVNLTTVSQRFDLPYSSITDDATAKLKFYLGLESECVYLDNVIFTDGTSMDTDNDGTPDCTDLCPNDMNKISPGFCGCGQAEGTCDDCHGDPGGSAFLDSCGQCADGNTGVTPELDPMNCITGLETESSNPVVYPNPTSGIIRFNESRKWSILNALGVVIDSGEGNSVDLSNQEKGIYLLNIGSRTIRIIRR